MLFLFIKVTKGTFTYLLLLQFVQRSRSQDRLIKERREVEQKTKDKRGGRDAGRSVVLIVVASLASRKSEKGEGRGG